MSATPRMSSVRPALTLVLASTLIFGCSLLKKKDTGIEDDPPVANAPTVAVTGTGAKNEKDVLRYKNETKVADEPATIGRDSTKAKTFPASGADVATLPKGTTVTTIAKYFSTGVLVIFDDPATADGTKLMGWITPEALAAPAAAVTPIATATQAAAPVLTAPKQLVDAGPKLATGADAGAVDAGGAADAGKAASADAGATPAAANAGLTVPPLPGNTCPTGFVLVGPACRRPCSADRDCPKGTVCLSTGAKKTCAATR